MYGLFFKAALVGASASLLMAFGIKSSTDEINRINEKLLKELREKGMNDD